MIKRRPTRREMQHLRTVAFHEAAHAVVSVELKDAFTTVDIIIDDERDSAGTLRRSRSTFPKFVTGMPYRSTPLPNGRAVDWIERRILVEFAGGLAQRRYAPRSDWLWGMGHDGIESGPCYDDGADTYHVKTAYRSDLYHIDEWLKRLGRYGDEAYRAELEARSKFLVARLWPDIQRVAKVLLKKKVLTQSQVCRLMNRAR
jgi:hypothetical protein